MLLLFQKDGQESECRVAWSWVTKRKKQWWSRAAVIGWSGGGWLANGAAGKELWKWHRAQCLRPGCKTVWLSVTAQTICSWDIGRTVIVEMVHWKLKKLCTDLISRRGHWTHHPSKHGEFRILRTAGLIKLSSLILTLLSHLNLYCERNILFFSSLLCTVACQEECLGGPPAWISLWLSCGVSYHLFLHTDPLTCSTVGWNLRGSILAQSWEWNFMTLINTQALEVKVINCSHSETDNWGVKQTWKWIEIQN